MARAQKSGYCNPVNYSYETSLAQTKYINTFSYHAAIIQHKYDSLTFDRETLKNTIRNSGYKHCILQTKIIRRAKSLSNKKLVEFQKNTENGVRHKVMFKQGLIDENRETCTDPSKLYPCKSCLSLKKHCDSYCDPPDRIQYRQLIYPGRRNKKAK
ncbi:hypothetical protein O9G_003973 [Rozella allomycis CSF55]|uniref:Uncharacterized protein n=1 Tax=Rozella allomycis (strain CSF55) TaxID=988480 RepID=A0A075AUM6_ROZAC|nr:hypothetical protein O9G_003973 [Rozella allomycis CSF55]|eukprot:EPZ33865.1 hypothetical protein O9G_003973 [Rozella allomycis CSF55]